MLWHWCGHLWNSDVTRQRRDCGVVVSWQQLCYLCFINTYVAVTVLPLTALWQRYQLCYHDCLTCVYLQCCHSIATLSVATTLSVMLPWQRFQLCYHDCLTCVYLQCCHSIATLSVATTLSVMLPWLSHLCLSPVLSQYCHSQRCDNAFSYVTMTVSLVSISSAVTLSSLSDLCYIE